MELMSVVGATPGPDRFLAPEIEAATQQLRHGAVSTLMNTYMGKATP
jgi:hypothetical protein